MTLITEIRKNVSESTPLLAVVGATDYAVERVRAAAKDASGLQDELEKRVQVLEEQLEKSRAALEGQFEKRRAALEGQFEKRRAALERQFEKRVQMLEKVPALVEERVRKIDTKSLQAVPALAVARALEAAGRVEQSYEHFAVRGKDLLDRVARQQATQDLITQGKVTLSRTRAAVTTARKAVDDTVDAALSAVNIGRQEATVAASEVAEEVAESVAATEKVVEERARATQAAAKEAAVTARKRAVNTRTVARNAVTSARRTAEKAVDAAEAAAAQVGDGPKPAE
ncbi:MAG TPA: hypothetical protein VI248_20200 [Kineosporiaceae bacterium]